MSKDTFLVGPMAEKTPANSKRTLFVVGRQSLDKILSYAAEYKITHIFMGANRSFRSTGDNTYWDKTITTLLDKSFWVTLEYEAHEHQYVLAMLNRNIWQSRMFVPLLSVRIPRIQTSNLNLTIKIDDSEFEGSNPGVWCMHYHEVMDSNRFTDWNEYDNYSLEQESKEEPTTVKESVSSVLNDGSLGIDPIPTTALTGEPEKILEKLNISSIDAAKAYADGATEDKLSDGGRKILKAKK